MRDDEGRKDQRNMPKKEIVTFDQRINALLLACSEVAADIKNNKSDIQKEMSKRLGVVNEVDQFTGQVNVLKAQLESLRLEKTRIIEEIDQLKLDGERSIREAEAQINRNLESSKKILHDAQRREITLNTAIAEFEAKKKDLEARHAKIAQLAGHSI